MQSMSPKGTPFTSPISVSNFMEWWAAGNKTRPRLAVCTLYKGKLQCVLPRGAGSTVLWPYLGGD